MCVVSWVGIELWSVGACVMSLGSVGPRGGKQACGVQLKKDGCGVGVGMVSCGNECEVGVACVVICVVGGACEGLG